MRAFKFEIELGRVNEINVVVWWFANFCTKWLWLKKEHSRPRVLELEDKVMPFAVKFNNGSSFNVLNTKWPGQHLTLPIKLISDLVQWENQRFLTGRELDR